MRLVAPRTRAIDLTTTPIHLGLGSRAMPVEGFAWNPDVLAAYGAAIAGDGPLREVDGSEDPVELGPGESTIATRGVVHGRRPGAGGGS